MTLHELLIQSARAALPLQAKTGAMPGGANGPWQTKETPLRNTGYWLVTFLRAHELTGERRFREAAGAAADYLMSPEHRPTGSIYFHRYVQHRDKGNGLIGQAWTMEALLEGGTGLERQEMIDLAVRTFLAHEQDRVFGLWRMRDVDGTDVGLCRTLNQQLWFATVGASLAARTGNWEVSERVSRGLTALTAGMGTYSSGLFRHTLDLSARFALRAPAAVGWDLLRRATGRSHANGSAVELAVGYHSFCLYAFALLKARLPDDDALWMSGAVERGLRYTCTAGYAASLEGNRYSYAYNLTGFENAFALQVLRPGAKEWRHEWIRQQVTRVFDFNGGFLNRGAVDLSTTAARIYEAVRLENLEVTAPVAPVESAPLAAEDGMVAS